MLLGLETLYLGIENADALRVAFFRVLAEQLLAYTNAKNGLLEAFDHIVQSACFQIFHSASCLALTRKEHSVGLAQLFGIIRE